MERTAHAELSEAGEVWPAEVQAPMCRARHAVGQHGTREQGWSWRGARSGSLQAQRGASEGPKTEEGSDHSSGETQRKRGQWVLSKFFIATVFVFKSNYRLHSPGPLMGSKAVLLQYGPSGDK